MAKTTKLNDTALATVLRTQHLVIARCQALACGVTPGALRHRTAPDGPWQRLLPGVYLTVTGVPTTPQMEIGGLLYAGTGSVITGMAALRRHGLRVSQPADLTVLIPAHRTCQSIAFVRTVRTARMPELVCLDGAVRYAGIPRAVADAARSLSSLREVRAVVASAVQARRCPIGWLAEELEHGPRRSSALLRRVLAEVCDGVRSVAEGDFRDLVRQAGLPLPMFNARLFVGETLLAITDAWWPEAGVAAEVDSREWHLSPADWQRTMRRHATLTAHGILVLHFTPALIRDDPARVTAELWSAIKAGRARPSLDLRALPATTS